MHKILEQVDAYLELLYEAREILLSDRKGKLTTSVTNRKKTNSKKPKTKSRFGVQKLQGASKESGAGYTALETRAISTVQPQIPIPKVAHSELEPTMSSDESDSASETVKRVPAKRGAALMRDMSHQRPKRTNRGSLGPTTPLRHPIRSNIVVVSAEQVRLEREGSMKPVSMRPTASIATGRLAFEALFRRS